MTLLDNTITDKTSSSHCGPKNISNNYNCKFKKNNTKKNTVENLLKLSTNNKVVNSRIPTLVKICFVQKQRRLQQKKLLLTKQTQ